MKLCVLYRGKHVVAGTAITMLRMVYMINDIFEYDLTRDEQLLVHDIKYAVTVNAELKVQFAEVIGTLLIYANVIKKALNFCREIDFSKLVTVIEKAMKICCTELARINTVQDEPMPEITLNVELLHKIDMMAVIQNAGVMFYDFLVGCCI